jgi:hypothetical protein
MDTSDVAQNILNELRLLSHVSEGELYLPLEVARALITRCKEVGVAIVGIEAFEIDRGTLHPRMDLIADFSTVVDAPLEWDRKVRRTTSDLVDFLNLVTRAAPHLYVNFVLHSG